MTPEEERTCGDRQTYAWRPAGVSHHTRTEKRRSFFYTAWVVPGVAWPASNGLLSRKAIKTANVSYPSLRQPLSAHAARVRSIATGLAEDGAETIHLVGHSLGGLVARCAMSGSLRFAGRLVTIGTPNQGALIADKLLALPPYRFIFGECGYAVSTAAAPSLPLPSSEFAVIAGGNGAHGFNPLLRGDNDGLVRVSEARIPAHEAGFLLVPTFHTVLMNHPKTIAAVMEFLGSGHMVNSIR